MPRSFAVAYEASPMICSGPVSPMTAYSTFPLKITAQEPPPCRPEDSKFQMPLELGTTMYGSFAAFNGLPSVWWKAVSAWKQQSVFSLHCVVRWPSQSMSISAFQNTAPFASQTGTVAEPESSSVLYLPLEIWLHPFVLASSSAADGPPARAETVGCAGWVAGAGAADAMAEGTTAAANARVTNRISLRIPRFSL